LFLVRVNGIELSFEYVPLLIYNEVFEDDMSGFVDFTGSANYGYGSRVKENVHLLNKFF
jgi:hypothetical protein